MFEFNDKLEQLKKYIQDHYQDQVYESYQRHEDTFVPTVDIMKEWFNEFNEQFFNNELPMLKLEVGNCGTNIWGYFRGKRTYSRQTRRWTERFSAANCTIRLSEHFAGTEYNLKNTMVHEMVHYYIFFKYKYHPARHHGKEFLYEANKINTKSEWNITPTNDYNENEVSDAGLEKFKNRILDTYIIGVFYEVDRWGAYHAFRTSEKYIDETLKTLKKEKIPCRWFNISVENPKFGVQTTVNRGVNFSYISSGDSVEAVLDDINNQYTIVNQEEFFPSLNIDTHDTVYLMVLQKSDGHTYCAKLPNLNKERILRQKYSGYKIDIYEVSEYDEKLFLTNTTKSTFKTICHGSSYNEFIDKMKKELNIDMSVLKKL